MLYINKIIGKQTETPSHHMTSNVTKIGPDLDSSVEEEEEEEEVETEMTPTEEQSEDRLHGSSITDFDYFENVKEVDQNWS